MNAKQITLKTIIDNNFIIGKTIRGKGTEILNQDSTALYIYSFSDFEKEIKNLEKLVEKENIYISSFTYDLREQKFSYENQPFTISGLIKKLKKESQRFKYITISKKEKPLGFISLNKYKSDKDSQITLVTELLKIQGLSILGDYYESEYDRFDSDSMKEFTSYHNDKYYDGDYTLEHGNSVCESKSNCLYFDGRMDNYNESQMDFYTFDESEYLKQIDPEETISVYHRKGKDWYIGYSVKEENMCINFKEENEQYSKEDCENEVVFFNTFEENKQLLEEVKNHLKNEKENLEIFSFIDNELDIDNDYRKCNVDFGLVDLLYLDSNELNDEIRDSIDWNYSNIESEFNSAYIKCVSSRFKILENHEIEVELYDKEIVKYKHLAVIKKLQKRYSFELIQSSISSSTETITWAIKQNDEEYHFNIAEVIANDLNESCSLRTFLKNALKALNKRVLEKLSEQELYEKASHIFVGFNDSLSSGNCEFGTKQFIAKHNINTKLIGGIRGDILLGLEKSSYTLRAVSYALKMHVA